MPSLKPLLLIRWPKTKLKLWWPSGTMIRTRTIAATPITCHQTETLLTSASMCVRRMLTARV